jgi:hypothetical protein
MRVLPDAEQDYRVEGVFVLSPKQLRRTPEDAAQQVLVAGARYAHVSLPVPIPLPIAGALRLAG